MMRRDPKNPTTDFSKITQAKYIKLGEKGKWDKLCFKDGTLRLGYDEVAADYSTSQGKKPVFDLYKKQGKTDGAASNHARQVHNFYAAGPETLWITFSDDKLWWCRAHGPVEFISHDKVIADKQGSRLRRTVSGWHDVSSAGKILHMGKMSGRLTKISGFRGTICDVQPATFEYLRSLSL